MAVINVNHHTWNRKIINIFWLFLLLSSVTEVLNLFLTDMDQYDFLIKYILIPTGINAMLISFVEIQYRTTDRLSPYILIICANLIANVLVNIHPTVDIIVALYFFPLIVALSYFKKSYIYLIILLNTVSFLGTYLFNDEFNANTTPIDLITSLFILLGAGYFLIQLLNQGFVITDTLINSEKDKKELLIKNTLLDRLVKTDMLTGLYNHKTFHEFLYGLIEQYEKHPMDIHLAVLDIDNFKRVNDTYGHRAGDEVITQIASIIKESVDPNDFAARYGGEEFAILLLEKDTEKAYGILEEIRRLVAATNFDILDNQNVTISIGFSKYGPEETKETFFNVADQHLYVAKRSGKNQIKF